jgi:shikimate dehydrogenase
VPGQGPVLRAWPGGETRVAAVIGTPIRHSLSPVLYNAAFRALDLDWAFVAFEVAAGAGGAAVEAMRTLGIEGMSVTMPHKEAAAAACDRRTATAEALGAVNSVVLRAGDLIGDSTDGVGFLDAVREDEGFDPAGCRALVLGAGGAARAVVLALAQAGAADVAVVGRTPSRAVEAAALAGERGRVIGVAAAPDGPSRTENPHEPPESGPRTEGPGVHVVEAAAGGSLSLDPADVGDGRFDLIVNATPVGMGQSPGLALDPAHIPAGSLVVDLIYHPPVTPLLEAARSRGAVAVNGLGMLIHQAAHQFRSWTGEDPPLEVMSAAAVAAIARRS